MFVANVSVDDVAAVSARLLLPFHTVFVVYFMNNYTYSIRLMGRWVEKGHIFELTQIVGHILAPIDLVHLLTLSVESLLATPANRYARRIFQKIKNSFSHLSLKLKNVTSNYTIIFSAQRLRFMRILDDVILWI